MGRRKITIQAIAESKIRHNTFNKRKNGLVKKAAELSMLCNVKMLLMFEDLHGNLIEYSTHGVYEPRKYFLGCKTPKFFEFTSSNYPNFFKGAMSEKKEAKNKFADKEADNLMNSPTHAEAGQFESLEANTKSALKLVEKLNSTRFDLGDIKHEHGILVTDKALNPEGRFTEELRKRQKFDETHQKLEYQSDCENNEEKMESEENESSDNLSESNSQNRTRNHSRTKKTDDPQAPQKKVDNSVPDASMNQLQALTLNYALNALQNPLNPLLLHNSTDLLALTKSMLLFSSWRNSGENPGNLEELLWGSNQNNLANINQSNYNLNPR